MPSDVGQKFLLWSHELICWRIIKEELKALWDSRQIGKFTECSIQWMLNGCHAIVPILRHAFFRCTGHNATVSAAAYYVASMLTTRSDWHLWKAPCLQQRILLIASDRGKSVITVLPALHLDLLPTDMSIVSVFASPEKRFWWDRKSVV